MKKTLFLILAVAFCASLSAQTFIAKDAKDVARKAYHAVYGANDEANSFIPAQRPSNYKPQSKGFSNEMGATHYGLATNANARNTIAWSPDGSTCVAVWTMGQMPGQIRGTGINYFNQDLQLWDPIPSVNPLDRIEQGPIAANWTPGWGTHAYTEHGELVVSHCTAEGGMLINYREVRHQGAWNQYVLKGPVQSDGSTNILWPTMVAVGDIVHMVCVTDQDPITFNGLPTYPLYYRSTDGGKTWEDYKTFEGIMPMRDMRDASADNFVFTARGNHVVLAYTAGRVAYLESKDAGITWTRKAVYDNEWDWYSTGVKVGPFLYASTVAAAIGDDGLVHIAFGTQGRMRDESTDPRYYSYWKLCGGMVTWKEGNPVLTTEKGDLFIEEDGGSMQIYQDYLDLPYVMNPPSIIGFENFYWWQGANSGDALLANYNNVGYISHPRLLAQDGKVYLMYSAIISEPMLFPVTEEFYRGVFLTVSHDNGDTYDQRMNTSWLSYHGDYFKCDWSGYEGPIREDDEYIEYGGHIEFITSSENGYPSMSMNIKNYRLVFTWLNDYFPYPEANPNIVWFSEPFAVYSTNIPIGDAGIYMNTDEVWRGNAKVSENDKIGNLKIYPNPVNDRAKIEVGTDNPYTLTVTNIMGQVVYTVKGQKNTVELDVANYPAGVYIVNVKTATATASQKLIVK